MDFYSYKPKKLYLFNIFKAKCNNKPLLKDCCFFVVNEKRRVMSSQGHKRKRRSTHLKIRSAHSILITLKSYLGVSSDGVGCSAIPLIARGMRVFTYH